MAKPFTNRQHRLVVLTIFALLLIIFLPLLLPILQPYKSFMYGDLVTNIYPDSARDILTKSFYIFDQATGTTSFEYMRYSPLFTAIVGIGAALRLSESFTIAVMNLVVISAAFGGLYTLYRKYLTFDTKISYLTFALITFFYTFNFYSITRINHIFLWHTYMVIPAMLYLGLELTQRKSYKNWKLLLYSLIITTWGLIPHGILYLLAFHTLIVMLSFESRRLKQVLTVALTPLLIYALVNIHFILTLFTPLGGYPLVITVSQLDFLSRNGSIINTLALANNWWIFVGAEKILQNVVYITSGLAISAIFLILGGYTAARDFIKRSYIRSATALFALIGIAKVTVVASGMNTSIGEWLVRFLDGRNMLGALSIVREWGRISILLPGIYLFVLILASRYTSTDRDSEANKGTRNSWDLDKSLHRKWDFDKNALISLLVTPSLLILILLNLSQMPIYQYLYEIHNPIKTPQEYIETAAKFKPDTKTLWSTESSPLLFEGNQVATWDNTKVPDKLPEYLSDTYSVSFSSQPLVLKYLQDKPQSKYLSYLNIGQFVKRHDILQLSPETSSSLLEVQTSSNPFGHAYLLPNNFVFLTDTTLDASNIVKLTQLGINAVPIENEELYRQKYLIVEPSEGAAKGDGAAKTAGKATKAASGTSATAPDLDSNLTPVFHDLITQNRAELISPARGLQVFDPETEWSAGTTRNVLHAEFTDYTKLLGINNYQNEYSDYILFTHAQPEVVLPAKYQPVDQINVSNSNDRAELVRINSGTQFDTRHKIFTEGSFLAFEIKEKTKGWKIVASPFIAIEDQNYLRVSLNLKLADVYEPHIKLQYYDKYRKLIGSDYIANISEFNDSGEFNYQFERYVSDKNTRYVKVAIWHSNQNAGVNGSRIYVKDIKVEQLQTELRYKTHTYVQDLENGGNQASDQGADGEAGSAAENGVAKKTTRKLLFARVLRSPKGNELSLKFNDRSFRVNTYLDRAEFEWVKIGEVDVVTGENQLEFSNIAGVNAIDTLLVISKSELEKEKSLAEENKYYDYDDLIYKIEENGTYILPYLRRVDYKVFYTNEDMTTLRSYEASADQLESLKVSALNTGETVWVIPVPLLDIAAKAVKPGEVELNREKPSKFTGSFETTERNQLLIFNELYDPNWRLKINEVRGAEESDAATSQALKSTQAFGVVNAYLIPEPGEYTFELEYLYTDELLYAKLLSMVIYAIFAAATVKLYKLAG